MISWCARAVSRSTADLGEHGVGGHGQPVGGFAVSGEDGGCCSGVAFDDEFVEVGGGRGVQRPEREVVDDEQVQAGQSAEFGVQGVVQPGGAEPGEQSVGAGHLHGVPAADRDVSQRCCQVGLSDADGAQDEDVVAGFEEPQRGQVGEQLPVVDQVGAVRSRCPAASAGCSPAFCARARAERASRRDDLVGQQQFQERGVAQSGGSGPARAVPGGCLSSRTASGCGAAR